MRLHLLCEKSGAILLVLVGRMPGWQSDEILEKFTADHMHCYDFHGV